MATSVTHGIRISVQPRFEPEHSDPEQGRFLFSYRIAITNTSEHTVQLLRRRWHIWDSLAPKREVEGPGVVGETPVLAPGEQFTYSSVCDLRSSLGRMDGTYTMRRADTSDHFEVRIPAFALLYPWQAN
ncbi:MAG: Co2+/Mg2+ efflux protein ApaG [Flavobacteriales bacterium]|nr:Co2+/Mg2+ efflux protein ApaG [Flavobacteriales bacterium]